MSLPLADSVPLAASFLAASFFAGEAGSAAARLRLKPSAMASKEHTLEFMMVKGVKVQPNWEAIFLQ
jgi:hypothetical protein